MLVTNKSALSSPDKVGRDTSLSLLVKRNVPLVALQTKELEHGPRFPRDLKYMPHYDIVLSANDPGGSYVGPVIRWKDQQQAANLAVEFYVSSDATVQSNV